MTTPFRTALLVTGLVALTLPARAERVENGTAVFAALDKVTARISELEVPVDGTANFGSLRVTPHACYSRPPTEKPKTTSFVEIEETNIDGSINHLFSGWMFAESPGLNALEHPVFDVWLTGCKSPKGGTADTAKNQNVQDGGETLDEAPQARQTSPFPHRRRIRR